MKPNTTTAGDPPPATRRRKIRWPSVITIVSAAILIGAEVFGAAYAGGWAVANLLDLERYFGGHAIVGLQAVFFVLGFYVMAIFVRSAVRTEPFFATE
jgi:hypothetical protein